LDIPFTVVVFDFPFRHPISLSRSLPLSPPPLTSTLPLSSFLLPSLSVPLSPLLSPSSPSVPSASQPASPHYLLSPSPPFLSRPLSSDRNYMLTPSLPAPSLYVRTGWIARRFVWHGQPAPSPVAGSPQQFFLQHSTHIAVRVKGVHALFRVHTSSVSCARARMRDAHAHALVNPREHMCNVDHKSAHRVYS
jgi:hypothetical protein